MFCAGSLVHCDKLICCRIEIGTNTAIQVCLIQVPLLILINLIYVSIYSCFGMRVNTVKPVLSSHLKVNKIKVLKTNGSLMKVESIAECSLGAFCNTFNLH